MKKSTLRIIFIVGVVLFSAVFIALTVDTMYYMPVSTRSWALTGQIVSGKTAWQRHDCTGCHTLLGNGAYYAPDLTKVHQTRGAAFLTAWLAAPAGQMPNRNLTPQEVQDLVAFFDWVAQIDTNGWPPQPIAARAAVLGDKLVSDGQTLFQTKGCTGCHGADAMGTQIAPTLMDITQKLDDDYLHRWLENPAAVKAGAAMPALGLNESEITALIAYLHTLD